MRNRYSLVYAWTVARIRAKSGLAGPGEALSARVSGERDLAEAQGLLDHLENQSTMGR